MSSNGLMPVGVDFGLKGGIVAVDGRDIVVAEKVPTFNTKMLSIESDDKKDKESKKYLRWEEAKHAGKKRKTKAPPARYKSTGELKVKNVVVFDRLAIKELIEQCNDEAVARGYDGVFIAVEEPQTFVGRSHIKTYMASGRCANGWCSAINDTSTVSGFVSPKHWKSAMGLGTDKQDSLNLAAELFDLPDFMTTDDDLCEAALIAHFTRTHAPRYLK